MRPVVKPDAQAGISLIEVLIAVLILSIGVVAGYRTLGQSRKVIGEELPRLMARTAALNRAEELKLLGAVAGAGLPREVRQGPFTWTLEVDQKPTEGGFVEAAVRASAPGQPGARYVVYVRVGPSP